MKANIRVSTWALIAALALFSTAVRAEKNPPTTDTESEAKAETETGAEPEAGAQNAANAEPEGSAQNLLAEPTEVVEPQTAMVQPTPAPLPAPSYVPIPPLVRRKLLFAGLGVFLGGYLFSALVGLRMVTELDVQDGDYCENCQSAGAPMFIPVVGPFIALPHADPGAGEIVCGIMGGVQVIGFALLVAGIAQYNSSKKAARQWNDRGRATRFTVGGGSDGRTSMLTLQAQF